MSSVFPSPDGLSLVALVYPNPSRLPVAITVAARGIKSEDDRNLLLQLGQATALACEAMRTFSEEHQLALTLQQSLLPRELPARPELEMAARYAPASDNAEIGGDFYEVSDIGGRLLIAVGDVVGHSIEAATVMGEVRHALRAYAVEGHGPVEILDLLDAMLRRYHPRSLTTLCLVVLDPASGALEIASAGHIPPLLADAAGARYVEVAGPLLGIGLPRPCGDSPDPRPRHAGAAGHGRPDRAPRQRHRRRHGPAPHGGHPRRGAGDAVRHAAGPLRRSRGGRHRAAGLPAAVRSQALAV